MNLKAPYAGLRDNLLLTKTAKFGRIIVFVLSLYQQQIMMQKKNQKSVCVIF